ncbi:MAG: hypothetical protein JNM17_00150 [Archangium sp.]|nr:hypothetical protein [Archangium sp.]
MTSALALTLVLAAAPSFTDVVKKFKPATLPLDSKSLGTGEKKALTAADVKVLAIKEHAGGELSELVQWMGPRLDGAYPVVSIARGDHVVLVVFVAVSEPMVSAQQTYLLSYSTKGEFLDGVRFSNSMTSEAGGLEELSTLNASGGLGRRSTSRIPQYDASVTVSEMVVVSDQVGKLTAKGTFELAAPEFRSRDGAFIDAKTKEELRVFGEQIFYRANPEKPFQKLVREGDSVRFKPEGKVYLLSWDERRKSLSCLNPDGSVQKFAREW